MLGFKEIDLAIAEAKLCMLRNIPKRRYSSRSSKNIR